FTPVPRTAYPVGCPRAGTWRVLLNSDSEAYGGTGAETPQTVATVAEDANGHPQQLRLDLPPLAALVLTPVD
ncbi:MAG: alpha amylase C-terminal domain-containing protein, partial [Pseudomonadota bacterium]